MLPRVFTVQPVKLYARRFGCLRPYQSVQQSSIAALKADIELGMADVRAGRVEKMDMSAIKAKGRALKKTS